MYHSKRLKIKATGNYFLLKTGSLDGAIQDVLFIGLAIMV